MRWYAPLQPWFDKSWKPGDLKWSTKRGRRTIRQEGATLRISVLPESPHMSCHLASVTLLFVLAANTVIAAETEAAPAVDAVPTGDVERMTPAQLRALLAKLDGQRAVTRDENAAASRRIEELEQRNAALNAKKAEVDARLAEVLERVASMEAARKD